MKIIKDDIIIFEGTPTMVANHFNINVSRLFLLNRGELKYVPRHYPFDMVDVGGTLYVKKEPSIKVRTDGKLPKIKVEIGFEITYKNKIYKITNMEQQRIGYLYTFNNSFKIRSRTKWDNYNTPYVALSRRIG